MAEEREPARRLHEGPTMRRKDQARNALPVSGDAQRAMPSARRAEHGGEDGRGDRAHPARRDEAWLLLEAGES